MPIEFFPSVVSDWQNLIVRILNLLGYVLYDTTCSVETAPAEVSWLESTSMLQPITSDCLAYTYFLADIFNKKVAGENLEVSQKQPNPLH